MSCLAYKSCGVEKRKNKALYNNSGRKAYTAIALVFAVEINRCECVPNDKYVLIQFDY